MRFRYSHRKFRGNSVRCEMCLIEIYTVRKTDNISTLRRLCDINKIVPLSFNAIAFAFAIASSAITDQKRSKSAACRSLMILDSFSSCKIITRRRVNQMLRKLIDTEVDGRSRYIRSLEFGNESCIWIMLTCGMVLFLYGLSII